MRNVPNPGRHAHPGALSPAGLDLLSSLQLCDADIGRLFGWRNRGRRVALELAQALAYLHSQVRRPPSLARPCCPPGPCLCSPCEAGGRQKPRPAALASVPARCPDTRGRQHQPSPRFPRNQRPPPLPTRIPLQGICHLDVKSANLLLAADGSAKLADMGFACALHSTNAPVGTFAWCA